VLFILAEHQLARGQLGVALAFFLSFTGLMRISVSRAPSFLRMAAFAASDSWFSR